MDKLCHFIRACCVLHNLASDTDLNFEYSEENEIVPEPTAQHETRSSSSAIAKELRDAVCDELWENRI